MSKTYVEIDFFRMEKQKKESSSFGGIQGVVSRINPQLLRTAMAAAQEISSSDNSSACRPSPATPLPVDQRTASSGSSVLVAPAEHTAPLTIFYGGAVFAFQVPRSQAEYVMTMAEAGCYGRAPAVPPENSAAEAKQLEGADLPMARRKSLQRFLEKRRERLAWAFPYHKKNACSRHC